MRALAPFASLAVSVLLLGGCAPAPNAQHTPPAGAPMRGDFSGSGPGTLIAAETLPQLDPLLRAETSLAARITYVSSSGVNDEHPQVTGTVFVPEGGPPPGGWRIVAVGHPMTGIHTECAPSGSPTLLGSAPLITVVEGYFSAKLSSRFVKSKFRCGRIRSTITVQPKSLRINLSIDCDWQRFRWVPWVAANTSLAKGPWTGPSFKRF